MVDWALSGDGVFLNIRCGPSAKMGNRRTCKGVPMVFFFFIFVLLKVVVAEILLGSFHPGGW